MKTTRLIRFSVALLVCIGAVWLTATSPAHSQAALHHSVFWYVAAGLLASLVLYVLLFTRLSGAPMERKYAALFRWIIPALGLFVVAALMEQDANSLKWQNRTLVLYYLCAVVGSIGTTPFLFGLIRKR